MRFLLAALFPAHLGAGEPREPEDQPSLKVSRLSGGAWPEVWSITNGTLEVRLTPAVGRMTWLGARSQGNLLRADPTLDGLTERPPGRWSWNNHGGDWLWPVQQSEWHRLGTDGDWPPPSIFDDLPWDAREVVIGGARGVALTVEMKDPLNIRIERIFLLSSDEPDTLQVRHRITRTGPSEIPLVLWQVAQTPVPDRVVLDVPPDSAFPKGWVPIPSDTTITPALRRAADGLEWVPTTSQREKFGNDGHWLRADFGRARLRISFEGGPDEGHLPDGGCSLAVMGMKNAYTELETMSRERLLRPGESMENVVVYRLSAEKP